MAVFLKKKISSANKTDEKDKAQNLALTPFEAHQLALQQTKEQKDTTTNAEKKALKKLQEKQNAQKDTPLDTLQTAIIDMNNDDILTVNVDNSLLIEELKTQAQSDIEPNTGIISQVENELQVNPSSIHSELEQKNTPKTGRVKIGANIEQVEEPQIIPIEEPSQIKRSWLERLRHGLSRSSRQIGDSISSIFTKRKLNEETLQDLEDVLIASDLGLETAMRITNSLATGRYGKDISTDEVRTIMHDEIEKVLTPVAKSLELDLTHKPHVILVVGVNGTGKTTTIGKLAAKLTRGGLKVMLAAGDTFRAAAIEQLHIWGKRTNSPVISTKLGADAASLAFDAYEKAKADGSDVLIIDTAGRLQNKTELMDELAKIVRVLGKNNASAPHTVLQTLDATTGQNALNQVEIFHNVAGVNGLVMTKLDGTARGGILVAIAAKHKLPVYFIGVGEEIDDFEPFKADEFAKAIAGIQN